MGYSGYESTPPRPFRILAGGILALVCAGVGALDVTHRFHQVTAMSDGPAVIDIQTFLASGPSDSAFVQITGVELHDPTIEMLEGFLDEEALFGDSETGDFDAESPEFIAKMMESHFNGADPIEAMVDAIQRPKLVPTGSDPRTIPGRLVFRHGGDDLLEAQRQIELDGSVTGFLSRRSSAEMLLAFLGFEDENENKDADVDQDSFYLTPMQEAPGASTASSSFLFTGLGMAFGLILCCSGGASIYTLWYFPVPSLISLAGYPMRYGRGGTMTRAVYFGVGCVLVGWGYHLMVVQGGFGGVDAEVFSQSMGFLVMFAGVAACLSVPSQILTRRFITSLDVQPKKKEVRMTYEQACSLEPVVRVPDYEDDELSETSAVVVPQGLKGEIQQLVEAGFNEPGNWVWHAEDGVSPAAIQLGCQEMIVSDIEWSEDQQCLRTRLVSVLGDGMTIVTVSDNFDLCESRTGSEGIYQKAMSQQPAEMLSMHLERVVAEAESREASVVAFESKEIRDVAQLGRRCLTAVRSQYGEVMAEVGEKTYGRFHFPPKQVTGA